MSSEIKRIRPKQFNVRLNELEQKHLDEILMFTLEDKSSLVRRLLNQEVARIQDIKRESKKK